MLYLLNRVRQLFNSNEQLSWDETISRLVYMSRREFERVVSRANLPELENLMALYDYADSLDIEVYLNKLELSCSFMLPSEGKYPQGVAIMEFDLSCGVDATCIFAHELGHCLLEKRGLDYWNERLAWDVGKEIVQELELKVDLDYIEELASLALRCSELKAG